MENLNNNLVSEISPITIYNYKQLREQPKMWLNLPQMLYLYEWLYIYADKVYLMHNIWTKAFMTKLLQR